MRATLVESTIMGEPIRDLSPAELICFVEEAPEPFSISIDPLINYMPSKQKVIRVFRAMQVTPDMLKYGIPIDGLSLLQRCALFVWFNSCLPENEKLLVPLCILPNEFDWSNEEKRWYRYCMSPDIQNWPLSDSSDVIASKLWQVCEELRNDEHLFSLLPGEVKSCQNFESLKQAVAEVSLEFSLDSTHPLDLVRALDHYKFFLSNPYLDEYYMTPDREDLVGRIISNSLHPLAVKFGFKKTGISYGERLRIYALFKKTQLSKELVCPILEPPPDEQHFKMYYKILTDVLLVGDVTDSVIETLANKFFDMRNKFDEDVLSGEDQIPDFLPRNTEEKAVVLSFLDNVESFKKR